MAFGFSITGAFGNIVVDDVSPVFQVVEQGYVGGPAPLPDGGGYWDTLHHVLFETPYDLPPLVILFPPDGAGGWLGEFRFSVNAAGKFTGFWVQIESVQYVFNGTYPMNPFIGTTKVKNYTPAQVAYGWTFAVASDYIEATSEQFGVRVWNDAGRLIYDSGLPLVYFRAPVGNALTRVYNIPNIQETDGRRIYRAPLSFTAGAKIGIMATGWASKSGFWEMRPRVGFPDSSRSNIYATIEYTANEDSNGGRGLAMLKMLPMLAAI